MTAIERGAEYGIEIARRAGYSTDSIYILLKRAEAKGYLKSRAALAGNRPVRAYKLTKLGLGRLAEARLVARVRAGDFRKK